MSAVLAQSSTSIEPTVSVALRAGLGNQLFQWAAGHAIALDWDAAPPHLDTRMFDRPLWRRMFLSARSAVRQFVSSSDQRYLYRMYDRKPELAELGVEFPASCGATMGCADLRRAWKDLGGSHLSGRRIIRSFADAKSVMVEPVLIAGWLQSEQLFLHRRREILAALSVEPTTEFFQRWKPLLQQAGSVAVHVRRGDRLKWGNRQFTVQSREYFNEAASFIRSKVANAQFFVFTDDPKWVRDSLELPGGFALVSGEENSSAIDDFSLMRLARHSCITSTFSWWTAWLGEQPNSIIIAPKWWLHEDIQPIDFIPSRWTVIDVPPIPQRAEFVGFRAR